MMNRRTAPAIAIAGSVIAGRNVLIPGITSSPITLGVRKIQASATPQNTRSVHFSPPFSPPSADSSPLIISPPCEITRGSFRNATMVSQAQAKIRNMVENGIAKTIQEKKSIVGAWGKRVSSWARRMPFGGVPISVAIPPIVPAKATARSRQVAKPRSSSVSHVLSPVHGISVETMANAMGIIIIADAVLDIHIERNAVATMNPKMSLFELVPVRHMIWRAIRLCRFHRCIAAAMRKPPMKRKTVWSA